VNISSTHFKKDKKTVYYAIDWLGVGILVFLTAVFLITGITIRAALVGNGLSLAGDTALLLAAIIALSWITIFACFRILVYVITDSTGITMVHGPWRHTIAWADTTRISEWNAMHDSIYYHWLAIWSIDGTRIQIRHDLVPHYDVLRTDIMHRLNNATETPDEVTNLNLSLTMPGKIRDLLVRWLTQCALALTLGLFCYFLLPSYRSLSLLLLPWAGFTIVIALGIWIFRHTLIIEPEGIISKRGMLAVTMHWEDIYVLERGNDQRPNSIPAILGRGLFLVLFRVDNRSGVALGPIRPHSQIDIQGGSGTRLRIYEKYYEHPEWLRARFRAHIQSLQKPRVAPLAKTGPLKGDIPLPPDPVEGDSALWLRESGEMDPFRIRKQ
jgi:hypothetical protein